MLERDCSGNRVHDQRPGGLALAHKLLEDVPVPLAGLDHTGRGLSEPRGDCRHGLGSGQRTLEHSRIGRDPQERPERRPSEADKFGPPKRRFQPSPALLMLLRSGMMGVEQQIRIDQDQR